MLMDGDSDGRGGNSSGILSGYRWKRGRVIIRHLGTSNPSVRAPTVTSADRTWPFSPLRFERTMRLSFQWYIFSLLQLGNKNENTDSLGFSSRRLLCENRSVAVWAQMLRKKLGRQMLQKWSAASLDFFQKWMMWLAVGVKLLGVKSPWSVPPYARTLTPPCHGEHTGRNFHWNSR